MNAGERATVVALTDETPTPLAETDRQGIAKIEDVRKLDDGRIGAHVTIADPVNHPHEVDVVLIFAQENGLWLLDEARAPESMTGTPSVTETPLTVTWPLMSMADGYHVTFEVSSGPADARPIVLTLRNSNGEAIENAMVHVALTPRGVGIPVSVMLANIDPGTYAGNASLPPSGIIEADITITLPSGTELNPAFTFPAS